MKYMRDVPLIFILLYPSYANDNCRCIPTNTDEKTHYGGNMAIVFKERKVYKTLHGVVNNVGKPISNVLVELFDHPDHLLLDYPRNIEEKAKQHRISACKTANDGKFCFSNIPPGIYEIRASMGVGWNVTSVWVCFAPRKWNGKKSEIIIPMEVGT